LPQTPDANLQGKSTKITAAPQNQPHVRAKSRRAGIDPAYTAFRAQNLPLEAFTVSAGKGEEERRGRADIELCLVAPLL